MPQRRTARPPKLPHGLGRAVINNRRAMRTDKRAQQQSNDSWLLDGAAPTTTALQSSTDPSNLDDFMATARQADDEFDAVNKVTLHLVSELAGLQVGEDAELRRDNERATYGEQLKIPRRPNWTTAMSGAELASAEKSAFVEWRRQMALLESASLRRTSARLTPFEKNLDIWRQLWRVVERSDVLVQICDARNPLLFYSDDLFRYARQVDKAKRCLLLVNKSDFLSSSQRRHWLRFFEQLGVAVAFFSAKPGEVGDAMNAEESATSPNGSDSEEANEVEPESPNEKAVDAEQGGEENANCISKSTAEQAESHAVDEANEYLADDDDARVLSRDELLDRLRLAGVDIARRQLDGVLSVGMVGYPNVGKSSTINCLMSAKRVSVSATPGKTKHFQTMFVESDLLLCDCPGLVMPSFASSTAEMLASGILSIDQMRDHLTPIRYVCSRIPRALLELTYAIELRPSEASSDYADASNVLDALARSHSWMSHKGVPDRSRSARVILKDYACGRLLFCHAPPDGATPQKAFHTAVDLLRPLATASESDSVERADNDDESTISASSSRRESESATAFDRDFLASSSASNAHVGRRPLPIAGRDKTVQSGKPWKKHFNQKRTKRRVLYRNSTSD